MCTVGLFDTLSFEAAACAPGEPRVRLTCDDPSLPCDGRNLVTRVAEALLEQSPASAGSAVLRCYRLHLEKRIPAGGGLGGGSSDAAFALQALNAMDGLGLSSMQLAELAARFGSDLSFFMFAPSAICRGRGEHVEPIAPPAPKWAVLVLPNLPMPTPGVYRRFDELEEQGGEVWRAGDDGEVISLAEPSWQEWAALSAGPLLCRLQNDLEAAAFSSRPELGLLRAEIEQTLSRPVRMSGSGSTLFTLYDQSAECAAAAARVEQAHRVRAICVEVAPPLDRVTIDNEPGPRP